MEALKNNLEHTPRLNTNEPTTKEPFPQAYKNTITCHSEFEWES